LLHEAVEVLDNMRNESSGQPSGQQVRQALDHLRDLNNGSAQPAVQDAAARATNGQELAEAMVELCTRDIPVLPRGEARRQE
jgi:hypothetical protein